MNWLNAYPVEYVIGVVIVVVLALTALAVYLLNRWLSDDVVPSPSGAVDGAAEDPVMRR